MESPVRLWGIYRICPTLDVSFTAATKFVINDDKKREQDSPSWIALCDFRCSPACLAPALNWGIFLASSGKIYASFYVSHSSRHGRPAYFLLRQLWNRAPKVKLTMRWCISRCVDNCAASLMKRCKFMPCLWNDPSANYQSAPVLIKTQDQERETHIVDLIELVSEMSMVSIHTICQSTISSIHFK